MRRQNGYKSYQGRRSAGNVLKVLLTLIVIGLLLVALGLLIGQRYIVYTDEGIRLELPFFQRDEPKSDQSLPVDIVQGDTSEPRPPEKYDPPVQQEYLRAVSVTLEELAKTGVDAVRTKGGNAAILEMKLPDGTLAYPSQQEFAQGLCPQEDQVSVLLDALHAEGMRAIARVSCFRDNALGSKTAYALLTNSGYRWNYDSVGLYWTGPAVGLVQDYLIGVVEELAALGFDEILLDNCGYPIQGQLGWIRPGDNHDTGHIVAFLESVLQALEGTDTVLSVCAPLDETQTRSGLTQELLLALNGRVFLTGDTQPEAWTGVHDPVRQVAAFEGEEGDLYQTIEQGNEDGIDSENLI